MKDASPPPPNHTKRVLLIGWEGADWRWIESLAEAGRMPHLAGMTERGVMGNLRSSVPMVCPILWTSIVTGVFGNHHDILSMVEPDGRGDVRPIQSTSRKRKAIWNILSQCGLRSAVVNWPATYPAEPIDGVIVSDRYPHASGPLAELWPADRPAIHPSTLYDTLIKLRLHPDRLSIDQLTSFVPRLGEVDLKKDRRVASIATLLAQAASVQQAATWIVQNEEWDFLAVHYGILGSLCHDFLRYRAPADEGVDARDAELYGNVVDTGYELLDMMLGRLLDLAGPETLVLVVSDHGFYETPRSKISPRLVPRLSSLPSEPRLSYLQYHRRDGVFCAAGPGVKEDELLHGARLTNVAPTILAYLGVPVPKDMEGRALTAMFESPPEMDSIRSHEPPTNGDGVHPRDAVEDPWIAQEFVDHQSALGLISLEPDTAAALESCFEQRNLNLAETLVARGRREAALDIYRKILERDYSFLIQVPIIQCLIGLKRFDEAEAELKTVTTLVPRSANVDRMWAVLHAARGNKAEAERYLGKAEKAGLPDAEGATQLGWIAVRLEQWDRARIFFERALGLEPESAGAHEGLGVALLRLGKIEDSIAHHLQSIHFLYYRSRGHVNLGESLVAAGRLDRAVHAFETALTLDPSSALARKWLSRTRKLREKKWRRRMDETKREREGDET